MVMKSRMVEGGGKREEGESGAWCGAGWEMGDMGGMGDMGDVEWVLF